MRSSALRFDFAPITGTEVSDEGYLKVWCRAARTGTQIYRRADGTQVREYRPEEEVSAPDCLGSFGMKPATYGHPPVLLDSANTKQYQIGYSGSQVRYSDGFVEVALVITDADAIKKIQRKDATEVSAGYRVEFDPTPGVTPEGESYEGVQRNIRTNHIAVVPRGRAGPEVKLLMDRMDAADAVAFEPEEIPLTSTPQSVMASVHLDGLELELPADAATAVQSHIKDLSRQLESAVSEKEALSTKLDSLTQEIESLAYDKETAVGRADALEEKVEELSTEGGSRLDQAEIDDLVAARMDMLSTVSPAFEDDYDFRGRSDADIYSDAFERLTGSAPKENASPEYIHGLVEGVLAARGDSEESEAPEAAISEEDSEEQVHEDSAEDAREDSSAGLRDALAGAGQKEPSAFDGYRSRMTAAWKQPLTATK